MNAYGFLGILTLIVFGRGYITLNEQFLVALCFIAFISTIIFYAGDDIQDYFETKQRELTADHIDFIQKTKTITTRLGQVLENKKIITYNLISINNIYKTTFNNIIKFTERKIANIFIQGFNNELQYISMIEISSYATLHNILVNLMSNISIDFKKVLRRLQALNN